MPGVAGLEQPLLDLIGIDLAQTPVAPLWDDALLEVDDVLVARRLRQQEAPGDFRFNVRGPVLFDHLAEQSQSVGDLLLDGGLVDRRQEFVALNFGLLLREPVLALARAEGVELPDGLRRAVRLQDIFPIAEIPVGTSAVGSLVNARVLNPHFQSQASSQRLKVTFAPKHQASPILIAS